MSISLWPCGAVAIDLPRPGEVVTVQPDGPEYHVNGYNFDRGFGWHVGTFPSYRRAMVAAKAHRQSELEVIEGLYASALMHDDQRARA